MERWPAALYLENGYLFEGWGFGKPVASGGEAVFNTGMSGYEEILTDPSYCKQIVVMNYPHIGNTGITLEDAESGGTFLSGLVVRDLCEVPSNWRAKLTLSEYLERQGICGITDVDTRDIVTLLRSEGSQRAVILPLERRRQKDAFVLAKARLEEVPPMEGLELVSQVSCKAPYEFESQLPSNAGTIVVYDFGVKTNILRMLKERRFRVWVVPYNTPAKEVLARSPVAVFLSNGPGDPSQVQDSVSEIRDLLGKVPLFAICMGHQVLAQALGASTYKLKFGHHGINHPVKDLRTNRVMITSQNHGFSVEDKFFPREGIELSHVNENDGTVEGFVSQKYRFMSLQFHPESAPGPRDSACLFGEFLRGYVQ